MTLDLDHDARTQTPAQWAVRWFALVAIAVLCSSVPLAHVIWHGLLGHDEPAFRTRSQTPAPAATWHNVVSGEWMTKRESELRELSPIVWWLRGNWNELRYRAGVPQSAQVHFGDEGWLFTQQSVSPDFGAFERATASRRAFCQEVRDLVRAAGAELIVSIVPDKARIYPEHAWPGGQIPERKERHYRRLLDELAALEIATVDLVAAMRAQRAAPNPGVPEGDLYYHRDTHWRPAGALIAGFAVAAVIEQRWGDRLSPRRLMQPSGETVVRAVGDLTSLLGLLAVIQPDPVTGQRPVALSLLTDQLAEPRTYYGVSFTTPQGLVHMDGKDPDAEILLLGTSFAEENGKNALSLALGRTVRGVITRGAGGMEPLREVLPELRAGTKAKVVVWEIIERGMFEAVWLAPKL